MIVVIGLIALLMSLLLPALRLGRLAARSTKCMSQLRQLSLAAVSYSTVNDDCYPPALLYELRPGGVATIAWDFIQLPAPAPAPGVPGAPGLPGSGIEPGPLWQYTDFPGEIMQDPLYDGPSNFGADPCTGFNYNTTYIGAEGAFPQIGPDGQVLDGWSAARRGVPPIHFHEPAATAVFGQGGYISGSDKFMRAPMNTVEGDLSLCYAGGQAFRAVGGTTIVAYLDAHVASVAMPRPGALATPDLLAHTLGFPRNGFLSDDDSAYDPR